MREYFKKFLDSTGVHGLEPAGMFDRYCTVFGVYVISNEKERKYLEGVVRHKVEVYKAGMELSEKFGFDDFTHQEFRSRLIWHDLSKFSEKEVIGYAGYNFKGDNTPEAKHAFECAWNHHKNHNDHHPEYWLSVNRDGTTGPLEMDTLAVYEMVADWTGAGRTYGNELKDWLPDNLHTFNFHIGTCKTLRHILSGIGFDVKVMDNDPWAYIVYNGAE